MAITLFIILLLYLLYLARRKKSREPFGPMPAKRGKSPVTTSSVQADDPSGGRATLAPEKPDWVIEKHLRLYQRKTFIKGVLLAKFHGELDQIKDLQQFVCERYFDISLYDAHLLAAEFRKNNEGHFPPSPDEESFPGIITPSPLPCSISYQGITGRYAILLHDVRLSDIDFNKYRLLHMEEDELVFGTIEATITGYLLENFREEYEVRVPVTPTTAGNLPKREPERGTALDGGSGVIRDSLPVRTGRTTIADGYRWQEFLDIRRNSTFLDKPEYRGQDRKGCLGSIGWIFLAFFALVFLMVIGPQGALILLLLAALGLVMGFFSGLFRPLLWLFTALFFLVGMIALIRMLAHGPDVLSMPHPRDQTGEVSFVVHEATVNGAVRGGAQTDSFIVHHRVWKDYSDSTYEGNIWVRGSDLARSSAYKDQLRLPPEPRVAYDRMLGAVSAGDSMLLPVVYALFDSIRAQHHLDAVGFAEVVVSFVQDIPYALILDRECDPELYRDAFTRAYLESPNAACSGDQRFGIHTPVEFMATLLGDCDSRTLLLYTLLSHYGYDVAIFSSEVYSHSLLGVVLPLEGAAYTFHNKRYVLWETTTTQMPPGIIAAPFNTLSNWRISLQSKN
ncbi:MAG TPA: hypothetical protein VHW43_14155 [Puia sp.]|nr:hypothetical protein [Puia sp.]